MPTLLRRLPLAPLLPLGALRFLRPCEAIDGRSAPPLADDASLSAIFIKARQGSLHQLPVGTKSSEHATHHRRLLRKELGVARLIVRVLVDERLRQYVPE